MLILPSITVIQKMHEDNMYQLKVSLNYRRMSHVTDNYKTLQFELNLRDDRGSAR